MVFPYKTQTLETCGRINMISPPRRQDAKNDRKNFFLDIFFVSWCLGGFIFCSAVPLGADDSVTLKYTYRPEQAQVTVLRDIQGKAYLPLMEVAQFYGIDLHFDSQTRRVILTKKPNQVKLVLSQPVFLISDPVESLSIEPVEMVSGQLGVPPESAEDLLSAILNVNVRFQVDQQTLTAGGIGKDELRREILAESPKGQTPPAIPTSTAAAVTEVKVAAAVPTSVLAPTEVMEAQAEPQKEQQVHPGRAEEEIPSTKQIYRVHRIVIDAGHGGKDSGAKGFDKRYVEKQATLDIAKKVAALLKEEPGLEVLMTRTDDYYITLKYRTEFANKRDSDLFVSIHCNSNPREAAHGTETYVYSARASNKMAAVAAVRENGGQDYLNFTLNDLHVSAYKTRSEKLAELVSGHIRDQLKQPFRSIQRANFYVLSRVDMPSILIETAFISNRKEENNLRDPYWRDKIAKAIADGILEYKDLAEGSIENQQARR
jgi:N-acetylmuramoyl-L-alanine amidase